MRYQQFNDRYIVRLESGEMLSEMLSELLRSQGIEFAQIGGAGALRSVRLGYWNAETRAYAYRDFDEQVEVVSFQGNAALKDGEPFLHLHGVFGRRDFSVFGGHVQDGQVHPTLEIWLRTEAIEVRRVRDEASGLDLMDLPSEG